MGSGPTDWEIKNIIMPLMLSGAKMLDKHCPKCGSPLFEQKGRVFCPVCEYRSKQRAGGSDNVESALKRKLEALAASLPDDVESLEKHLRVMELIMDLLERYKKWREDNEEQKGS